MDESFNEDSFSSLNAVKDAKKFLNIRYTHYVFDLNVPFKDKVDYFINEYLKVKLQTLVLHKQTYKV